MRGFDCGDVGRREFSRLNYDWWRGELNDVPGVVPNPDPVSDAEARRRAQVVLGGTQQALAMFELEFPLVKEAGIRGVAFYDVGMAHDDIVDSYFREDFGFGVRWFSPIGPLRFEWGFPLDRRAELNEEGSEFHFAIGAPF
jgi:outer membrane protein insertion porin family